ncbi:hypothetical protein AB0F18_10775 [Streptomyces sp. NPDC029216]|uniref:hypothetical protein n=1 Tax=Streptomyces sp. NPDC029216 TaxID=3154701 RepID=UPI0034000702
MKLKRLALTALTAALLAAAVPATAHAGTTPPADPSGGTTSCRWISPEELRQRYTPEAIALLQAAGSLRDGQLWSCSGGGTGNGWGPLPPSDGRTV